MKPYGLGPKTRGSGPWKIDYHIHRNNRKVENWWADMQKIWSRRTMKQKWRREVDNLA